MRVHAAHPGIDVNFFRGEGPGPLSPGYCRDIGLSIHASGESSHYPAWTLLLTIRRADGGTPEPEDL